MGNLAGIRGIPHRAIIPGVTSSIAVGLKAAITTTAGTSVIPIPDSLVTQDPEGGLTGAGTVVTMSVLTGPAGSATGNE